MFLNERLNEKLIFQGVTYYINMDFSNILRLSEMLEDKELDNFGKVRIGLLLLIDQYSIDGEEIQFSKSDVVNMDYLTQYRLLMTILKEKLDYNISDEDIYHPSKEKKSEPRPEKKEFDFAVDGERIYASFLMDYDIDLIEQQGKLHWKKFLALFQGLSEKTPFMKVVHIRTMDVPKSNKHNQDERKRILELKQKYAIETQEKSADDAFENMVSFFGGKAGDNHG